MRRYETREEPLRAGLLSVGLGFAVLFSTGVVLSAQEDSSVRWYDIRGLQVAPLQDPDGVDLRLPLVATYLDYFQPDRYDVRLESDGAGGFDDWPSLIQTVLGEDGEDPGFSIDVAAGFLLVEGDARIHEQVAEILAEVGDQLTRTVELEVFVLPSIAISRDSRAVLTAAEANALLAAADPVEHSRKSAHLGQRVRLGSEGVAARLYDYDVEVAQKARIADPVVTVIRDGIEVGAVATARLGGGFFLRAWGRRVEPGAGSRQLALAHLAGVSLELPEAESTLCVGSAVVPDGGGLLLGHDWSSDGIWLIRVRHGQPGRGEPASGSVFLPLSELTATPLVVPSPWLPRTAPSGGWEPPRHPLHRQLGDAYETVFSAEDLYDRVQTHVDQLGPVGSAVLLGDSLYVRGSTELLERSTADIRELTAALASETVEIDVRLGLVEPTAARELVAQEKPEVLAQRLGRRLIGACRLGDTLLVVGGKERFYLKDHDVEIAQASAIPDPIVGNLFDGVSFWCRPNRVSSDTISAWVDLQVQGLATAPSQLSVLVWEPREPLQRDDDPAPSGTFTDTAIVELPTTARADLCSAVRLVEGKWTLLCCTGFAGTDHAFVAVARIRSASR